MKKTKNALALNLSEALSLAIISGSAILFIKYKLAPVLAQKNNATPKM